MAHPLESYRAIAKPDFIVHVEEKFYTTHHDELINGLHVEIEKEKDRMYINGIDLDGNGFEGYVTLSSFLLKEYDKLEKETRSNIDDTIFNLLDESKQKIFVTNIIAELQALQNSIKGFSIEPKYISYKDILLNKVISFNELLKAIYQHRKQQIKSDSPKIKWLGTNKQLGTLFFDLWKGQKGTSKNPKGFKKIIEVDKKEHLMNIIFDNFVNKDGKELSLSSLSDQLNESETKNDQRAIDDRIELSC